MSDTGALDPQSSWPAGPESHPAHYRKRHCRPGAILLGVVLAVTLLIGVKATNDNAINSYREAGEALGQQASLLSPPRPAGPASMKRSIFNCAKAASRHCR